MKLSELKVKGSAPIVGKGFGKEGKYKIALIKVLAEMSKNGEALTRKEILERGKKLEPELSAANVTTNVVQDAVKAGAVKVRAYGEGENKENYFYVTEGIDVTAKGAINRKYQKKAAKTAPVAPAK